MAPPPAHMQPRAVNVPHTPAQGARRRRHGLDRHAQGRESGRPPSPPRRRSAAAVGTETLCRLRSAAAPQRWRWVAAPARQAESANHSVSASTAGLGTGGVMPGHAVPMGSKHARTCMGMPGGVCFKRGHFKHAESYSATYTSVEGPTRTWPGRMCPAVGCCTKAGTGPTGTAAGNE